MAKISSTNVIEYFSETIQSINAFTDDHAGNTEAEKWFTDCAIENGFTQDDVEYGLEEGVLKRNDGYELYIAHA